MLYNRPSLFLLVFEYVGAYPTAEEWADIVDICKSNDAYLFSDEMYRCVTSILCPLVKLFCSFCLSVAFEILRDETVCFFFRVRTASR